jgi:hypothetical protein
MSDTGKQSPLGVNAMSGLLQGKGFWINKPTSNLVGYSSSASTYTQGTIISTTILKDVTNAIRQGWVRYNAGELSGTTYNNLISIGSSTIPALGNSPPPNYSGSQTYNIAYTGENASYGYVRIFPLQAYNEFNYNNTLALSGMYNDFLGSFISAGSFVEYSNKSISTMYNSLGFLKGTYSNMNDLITADVTNVNLSTAAFGRDLINLGKALDLSTIWTFGYPSNLLATLKKYNAITDSLKVALLASGLTAVEIDQITENKSVAKEQQQKLYSAFLIIGGVDLAAILVPLNCNTPGLTSLADLLNVKKMFPESYLSLTVPIYNAVPGPTNSKTYYPIYTATAPSPPLTSPAIKAIVGTTIPPGEPPYFYTDRESWTNRGAGAYQGTPQALTDRDGNPIGDGFGGSWNSGFGPEGDSSSGDGPSGGYSGTGGGYGFGSPSSNGGSTSGGGEGGGGQPGGGGDSCFVKGTLITLADNSKRAIEDIIIGDAILGLNGVNYVLGYDRPSLIDTFRAGNLYGFNGLEKFVTSEHPFMTKQGWKSIDPINAIIYEPKLIDLAVGMLEVGDEILTEIGSYMTVNSIEHYKDQPQQLVYNLVLDGDHTYYANGLLVHNKE